MEILRRKTLIAVLWVIWAMGMSVFMFLSFMKTGEIEGIISGEFNGMQINDGLLLWFGAYWFIPWILAFLSLTLKGSANRWVNFIMGILFTLGLGSGSIVQAINGQPFAIIIDYIICVIVTIIIAWNAWKLPKREEIVTS
jgi:hypothetical protein